MLLLLLNVILNPEYVYRYHFSYIASLYLLHTSCLRRKNCKNVLAKNKVNMAEGFADFSQDEGLTNATNL